MLQVNLQKWFCNSHSLSIATERLVKATSMACSYWPSPTMIHTRGPRFESVPAATCIFSPLFLGEIRCDNFYNGNIIEMSIVKNCSRDYGDTQIGPGGGVLSEKLGMRMCGWERSPFSLLRFNYRSLFSWKVVLLSGAFFILAFSLRISYKKTVKFVWKFSDRRVKRKIWFKYSSVV